MSSLKELKERQELAQLAGGKDRIERQLAQGKLTARKRLELLLDPESFFETDLLATHRCSNFGLDQKKIYGDGVITGYGNISDRKVFVFAQDFTVFGGSLAAQHAKKITKIMDRAAETGAPIIGLNDSGGARIQEGVESLAGYADIFLRNVDYSGVVPQISMVLGPCAGGAVYSPAITDFIIMSDQTAHMFITGPDVIKAVTREEVSKEELGGAKSHATKSGVADLVARDEQHAMELCKVLLSFIPQSNLEPPLSFRTNDSATRLDPELDSLVPEDERKPYDIKQLISTIADNNYFFELKADFARNIVTGFIRLNGKTVAVIANQPKHLAGCLDIDASCKAARFVRFCDAFNIPLLTLVDVPGFLPGVRQEHGGIIKNGAKLLYAFAEATVPRITIITRKAYGGAYDVMNSKHIRADFNFAFPSAEIAVMGSEAAVDVIFRKELAGASQPEELKEKLTKDYRDKFANPWEAASLGFIDAVIEPNQTRKILIETFRTLENKQQARPKKKHGNIPL